MSLELAGQGVLVALEGADGVGKTTQARLLVERLRAKGYDAMYTRQPGGSPQAERIRKAVLDPSERIDARTEALLMSAARSAHVMDTVLPALREGKVVVCDRYTTSGLVYQSASGVPLEMVSWLNRFSVRTAMPDLEIYLRAGSDDLRKRLATRGGQVDRVEKSVDLDQIVQGFDALLGESGDRVVDAMGSVEKVAGRIEGLVTSYLSLAENHKRSLGSRRANRDLKEEL